MSVTEISPREHDEAEAQLWEDLAKAQREHEWHQDLMHTMAADKKSYAGRQLLWNMTGAQVHEQLRAAMALGDEPSQRTSSRMKPSGALSREQELLTRLAQIQLAIEEAEKVWREHRWPRYILCLSYDGHIHNYRGCHTLRPTSLLEWHPEFSGLSEDQAVNGAQGHKGLGPILCTHCFPSAPSEWKLNKSDVTRAEREAAKREREEAKLIKRLRPEEQFKDHNGWKVDTVAGCKQALRDERELFYYYGHGPHCSHAKSAVAAEQARKVLLAREAARPGTGATQAEIDQIIARADKKHRGACA